jgi:hypothetical protein
MRISVRAGAVLGALVFFLSSCVDTNLVVPDATPGADPSMAIFDGSTTGNDEFFFYDPLGSQSPTIAGDFNPFLQPAMQVCVIAEGELGLDPVGGKPSCFDQGRTVVVSPGSLAFAISISDEQYRANWDTDGPETDLGSFDQDDFLLLEIVIGDHVVGWADLDPQDPDGPGESTADAYAFRLGETIPVKFFLGTQVLCEQSDYVTECISSAVVDETGANLSLDEEGNKLGVIIFEGSLPGEDHPPITVTIERIDPTLFLLATGTQCLPLFDAPQFGDCFRISTTPELTAELDIPALVSICLDPTLLDGIDLSEAQQNQLTMIRFGDFGDGVWEALPDAAGDCPTQTASLLQVPEHGLFRFAALGINAVAGVLGPQPLAASDIRLGGLTSSFSRFRYALPGQMIPTAGDGVVIQPADDGVIEATVQVVDHEGVPVENATVHFDTDDGTLSATEAISDATGNATVTWTVDKSTAGDKTLTASALGLLADQVPEHSAAYFFTIESVTLTATVVPESGGECSDGWGTANVDGAFAAEEWDCASSFDFTANISGGAAPATVYWMNDGETLYFGVRVPQSSLDKANSLRIDFDNDGDGVTEVGDDAIGYDAGTGIAIDQYLDARCVNRNQSGCGVTDTYLNVEGAIGNDGTYTTFEISHPLGGDAAGQDLVRSAGDPLGFFLTLRIGKGAQGNTQVPGFRNYRIIIIQGS